MIKMFIEREIVFFFIIIFVFKFENKYLKCLKQNYNECK